MSTGKSELNIALAGNPNSGKSSLFNLLTGLNQKVGNFPGITVDKKTGYFKFEDGTECKVVDLPGSYSIYPKSEEEQVVMDVLGDKSNPDHPDITIVIADATNLKRNLLLFCQVHDLGIPTVLALNMIDIVNKRGKEIDIQLLEERLGIKVVPINARDGDGLETLKSIIKKGVTVDAKPFYNPHTLYPEQIEDILQKIPENNSYQALQHLHSQSGTLGPDAFDSQKAMRAETLARYDFLDSALKGCIRQKGIERKGFSKKLDKVLTHKIWGYLIFLLTLFIIFQAIFKWAEFPMEMIDLTFSFISNKLGEILPSGLVSDLFINGIIPGIAGIVIFIPQIAILFAFISLLEESGYMSRVVFLLDKIMRNVGLSGKSIVPLISGVACAVPAIMATRVIGSKRDRIITILVTPLMSCSARLPVYTILIALIIPETNLFGMFNLQGVTLLGMYLLGFFAVLMAALIFKSFIKTKEKSYLVMEMPSYKIPRWQNVTLTIWEKTKTFIFEAGKVILAISIILWVASSYGPSQRMEEAVLITTQQAQKDNLSQEDTDKRLAAAKLENSFAGIFGKTIEPLIAPLGYDWKIGISLISSFAAREVFVGTMATIYSLGSTDDELTVKNRMAAEINPKTGKPMFNFAVGMSLMIFYAFAMQCMSTLAVVYRETKGWRWPIIQLLYMSVLAYLSSLAVYQLLS